MIRFEVGAKTDQGQVRQTNQDHVLAEPEAGLFAVADGMGGHRGGEVASEVAITALRTTFVEHTKSSLIGAVQEANAAIVERASSDPDLLGMGTTLCAMALMEVDLDGDGQAQAVLGVVNVGDSRLYLLEDEPPTDGDRSPGSHLRQITEDHSLVATLERQGQLTKAEAAIHPHRNILTKALGIDAEVVPDLFMSLPFAGDRYLICSDGLFNEVTEDRIVEILRDLTDPQAAAEELVRLANANGGRDNISVVIVDVVDDEGRSAEAEAAAAATQRLVRTEHGGEVVLAPEVTQSMVAPSAPPPPAPSGQPPPPAPSGQPPPPAPSGQPAPAPSGEPAPAAAIETQPTSTNDPEPWDPSVTTTVSPGDIVLPQPPGADTTAGAPPDGGAEPFSWPAPPADEVVTAGPGETPAPPIDEVALTTSPLGPGPPGDAPPAPQADAAARLGDTAPPAPPAAAQLGDTAPPAPAPGDAGTAPVGDVLAAAGATAAGATSPPLQHTTNAAGPTEPPEARTAGFEQPAPRGSRFTWRVVAFILALLVIAGVVVGAVYVLGKDSCTVTVEGNQVVVKKGIIGATTIVRTELDARAVQTELTGSKLGCGTELDRFTTTTAPPVTAPPVSPPTSPASRPDQSVPPPGGTGDSPDASR